MGNARRTAAQAFVCAAALLVAVPAVAAPDYFDRIFSNAHEPPRLHYRVQFVANGGPHLLEIWREGDRRLKRATDNAIVTHAVHRPGSAGYTMVVLDLRRHISTHIDRTNLYRIGNFTDWFDLGHGLRHPQGHYSIRPATAPQQSPAPLRPCRWFALTQGAHTSIICWDRQNFVPQLITNADGHLLWQVMSLDTRPIAPVVFQVDDKGFIHNDASRDIGGD